MNIAVLILKVHCLLGWFRVPHSNALLVCLNDLLHLVLLRKFLLLEIIFHQGLAIGHDCRGGAPLWAAPVPASLFLVLVEKAAGATAAEEHENQEDEHHGRKDDADNAANAGYKRGTKFVNASFLTNLDMRLYLSPILLTPCAI